MTIVAQGSDAANRSFYNLNTSLGKSNLNFLENEISVWLHVKTENNLKLLYGLWMLYMYIIVII